MAKNKWIFLKYYLLVYHQILLLVTGFVLMIIAYSANFLNLRHAIQSTYLLIIGNKAYTKNDFGDAEIFYKRTINLSPETWPVQYNLANDYYRQGRYMEAVKLYYRFLMDKRSIDKVSGWNNLGNALFMQGMKKQSLDAYKSALLLNDNDLIVRRNFLFVARQLAHQKIEKTPVKKNEDNRQADNNNRKAADEDRKKSQQRDQDNQAGQSELSDKDIDRILKVAQQKEEASGSKKRRTKNSIKNLTNEPDY